MKEVKATPEWHWYCPKCKRSCLSRIHKIPTPAWIIMECADCGESYKVVPKHFFDIYYMEVPSEHFKL